MIRISMIMLNRIIYLLIDRIYLKDNIIDRIYLKDNRIFLNKIDHNKFNIY